MNDEPEPLDTANMRNMRLGAMRAIGGLRDCVSIRSCEIEADNVLRTQILALVREGKVWPEQGHKMKMSYL